jgi:hypothetical protein
LRHFYNSAPGPGGLPYSAWVGVHQTVHSLFKDVLCEFLHTHRLPAGYNACNVNFAKGKLEGDCLQVCQRPDAMRPTFPSNSRAKLVARIINSHLAEVARLVNAGVQWDFVKGRCLVSNIAEVESHAIHISKYYFYGAGIVLSDSASAFPSFRRDLISVALCRFGVPQRMLQTLHS